MRVLGAIIAGGASRRFGRDKAVEMVAGQMLIEAVEAALAGQTDEVVICGRHWADIKKLDDRPEPHLGPLGGINAALQYASAQGFSGILCMPVDVHPAPVDIAERLTGKTLAVLNEQVLIGFWPKWLVPELNKYLRDGNRSVHGFLRQAGARRVADPPGLININRTGDLALLKQQQRPKLDSQHIY